MRSFLEASNACLCYLLFSRGCTLCLSPFTANTGSPCLLYASCFQLFSHLQATLFLICTYASPLQSVSTQLRQQKWSSTPLRELCAAAYLSANRSPTLQPPFCWLGTGFFPQTAQLRQKGCYPGEQLEEGEACPERSLSTILSFTASLFLA